jgi:ABC-type dipeptide/oligopeptide/nickel transport system ATPase component
MTDNREQLTAIEGQPPDLASLPPGCAFAPRCPAAFDRCHAEEPPEFALGEGRTARCWLVAPDTGTAANTRTEANGPTIGSGVT